MATANRSRVSGSVEVSCNNRQDVSLSSSFYITKYCILKMLIQVSYLGETDAITHAECYFLLVVCSIKGPAKTR